MSRIQFFLFLLFFLLVLPIGIDGAQGFLVDIPLYKQEHRLSCEVASLRSALAYKGVNVSESELIKLQPVSGPARYSRGVWGDPSKGYVGNINGSQPRMTGYGIYWEPVAKMANKYRPAIAIRKAKWPDITSNLKAGNAVIVWGNYTQNPRAMIWKTSEGAKVLGFVGEHTYVVTGWEGTAENPTQVNLVDPMRGRIKMSYADFMKNWSYLDHSAVIIN
ncbi:MAG: C39 family peptidase [Patescibacteria group bacterium]|nr:C39 family peptidase [Patescibacteria group bacterium]